MQQPDGLGGLRGGPPPEMRKVDSGGGMDYRGPCVMERRALLGIAPGTGHCCPPAAGASTARHLALEGGAGAHGTDEDGARQATQPGRCT